MWNLKLLNFHMCTSRQTLTFVSVWTGKRSYLYSASACQHEQPRERPAVCSQSNRAALVKQPGSWARGLFSLLKWLSLLLFLPASWLGRGELAARARPRCQAQRVQLYSSAFRRAGGGKEGSCSEAGTLEISWRRQGPQPWPSCSTRGNEHALEAAGRLGTLLG